MKAKDIRGMDEKDLIEKEKSLKKELFDLNFQKKIGRVEKPSRFKAVRREIARIKTVQSERQGDKHSQEKEDNA